MQFTRGPQRDERRRRALAEEMASTGDEPSATRPTATPLRSRRAEVYAPGAKPEHQRRVVDLVPRSYVVIGLWFLAGLTAIAGLAAAHVWHNVLAERISAAGSAPLELGSRGSLASWFASVTLGLASLLSLLVYAIRRHKLDDYRGHYRWWLLASAAWLAMSIDATAGIHQLIGAALVRVSGQIGPLGETTIWLGGSALVLAAMSARLLWDMRRCRPAVGVYFAAIGAWGGGLAIQFSGTPLGTLGTALPAELAKLLGHLLLLLSLGLYARHVILHVQGLLPGAKSRAKAKARRDAKPAGTTGGTSNGAAANIAKIDAAHSASGQPRTDLRPHISPAPASRPAATARSFDNDDDADYDDDDDDSDSGRRLSRAERKRLRRQKAAERGR